MHAEKSPSGKAPGTTLGVQIIGTKWRLHRSVRRQERLPGKDESIRFDSSPPVSLGYRGKLDSPSVRIISASFLFASTPTRRSQPIEITRPLFGSGLALKLILMGRRSGRMCASRMKKQARQLFARYPLSAKFMAIMIRRPRRIKVTIHTLKFNDRALPVSTLITV